jgi:hypothetical protein
MTNPEAGSSKEPWRQHTEGDQRPYDPYDDYAISYRTSSRAYWDPSPTLGEPGLPESLRGHIMHTPPDAKLMSVAPDPLADGDQQDLKTLREGQKQLAKEAALWQGAGTAVNNQIARWRSQGLPLGDKETQDDLWDKARRREVEQWEARASEVGEREAERQRKETEQWEARERARQAAEQEAARREAARQEAARQAAEREAARRQREAERQEAERQEAARRQREAERQEAEWEAWEQLDPAQQAAVLQAMREDFERRLEAAQAAAGEREVSQWESRQRWDRSSAPDRLEIQRRVALRQSVTERQQREARSGRGLGR